MSHPASKGTPENIKSSFPPMAGSSSPKLPPQPSLDSLDSSSPCFFPKASKGSNFIQTKKCSTIWKSWDTKWVSKLALFLTAVGRENSGKELNVYTYFNRYQNAKILPKFSKILTHTSKQSCPKMNRTMLLIFSTPKRLDSKMKTWKSYLSLSKKTARQSPTLSWFQVLSLARF